MATKRLVRGLSGLLLASVLAVGFMIPAQDGEARPPDFWTEKTYYATDACEVVVGKSFVGCDNDHSWGQVTAFFTVETGDCVICVCGGD